MVADHPGEAIRRMRVGIRYARAGALAAAMMGTAAHATPQFVETACDIPVVDEATRGRLRCGTVSVPRDPDNPQAGTIELAVVVRRSASPRPGAVPVLILHGGPGGEQTRHMGMSRDDLAPGRDSIAFDMRGGGRTGPALCPDLPGALLAATRAELEGRDAVALRSSALAACADEFVAAGFAPAHFGTARNVADAESVRAALGLRRWAVYGMSYGTAVAAEYLARHPAAIESVVLDSLYPPDAFVPPVGEAQGRAVTRLLDECAADAACAGRFPGLDRARVDAALAALDGAPLAFHLGGQRYQADETAVRRTLHGLFYSEATARAVPWFLDAVVRGDGEAIAAALGMPVLAGELLARNGGSMAALFATDCRDRARHHAPAAGPGPSWMALFGGIPDGACRHWPLGTPPGLPTGTAVPVLVLAAGYDGFQPDAQAVAAAIGPAATALTIPRAAHVVRGAGACPRGIVAGFIDDPTQAPDTACLASMQAPPFLLDARPLPAAVALAAAIESGRFPGAALAAIAGLGLLASGLLVPFARWLRQRLSRFPAAASAVRAPRALALAGGLCGVGGAVLPMLGTLQGHPGAAAFGLDPTLALGLWALPFGLALSVVALVLAAHRGQVGAAVAAVGGLLVSGGPLLLGLVPWH